MALRYVNYGDVIVLRSADEKEAANFGYINGDGIVNKESSTHFTPHVFLLGMKRQSH